MQNIKIGNMSMVYTADDANTLYTMAANRKIESSTNGLDIFGMPKGREFEIGGKIYSDLDTVRIGSASADMNQVDFTLGKTGRIESGSSGIVSYGMDHVIRIDGKVDAVSSAIETHGRQTIVNTGEISGNVGINLYAIGGESARIVNTGNIEGTQYSIFGTSSADTVVNRGNLTGTVYLGIGEDTFVFKSGKIDGAVYGGGGDDTFTVHAKGLNLIESDGDGYDTVRSSVTYTLQDNVEKLALTGKANIDGAGNDLSNDLYGNAGRNMLAGGGGADFLNGGKGNDVLVGGDGVDTFYFQRGTGRDTIRDFESSTDDVYLNTFKGTDDFDDMIAHHAVEKHGDVIITYGTDVIVLKDHVINDLQSADFLF